MKRLQSRGFTIIELLIATVIFSVILLVITGAIVQFSRLYYKGTLTSKTQETARAIADELSRAAQFSGGVSGSVGGGPNDAGYYCFGNKRYSVKKGTLVTNTAHAFVADEPANCTSSAAMNVALGAAQRELLGDNMKLLDLRVAPITGSDQVEIVAVVAYGNDVTVNNAEPNKSTCPVISLGGQFCAVSSVKTTVTRRLGTN